MRFRVHDQHASIRECCNRRSVAGLIATNMEETYFYHSFPRTRKDQSKEAETALAFEVLTLVMRLGLLLVPEMQTVGGVELCQGRICFTALAPRELPKHAARFGLFALEYHCEDLMNFGALPAIYLPDRLGGVHDIGDAGVRFLQGLDQLKSAIEILKDAKDPVVYQIIAALGGNKGILHNLVWVPVIAQNLFYPAGSTKYAKTGLLGYYEQREWKIINNFPRVEKDGNVVWDFKELTADDKLMIVEKNAWFAGELSPGVRRIDRCQLLIKVGNISVVDKIRRIIVPREHIVKAKNIVNERVPVVALEDVADLGNENGAGI